MITTDGGRFDFDDGGCYIGEWDGGRAHGLGIATGPENQGEYAGEWVLGFESCGVYLWPSGNYYEGTWLKGKRHGEGVQVRGRWFYKGAFSTGFCGRYGVKESMTSQSKYEGSWHLNQFDGFGIETNSDGATYAGAWSKGLRQGLGVRRSVPYGLAADYRDAKAVRYSQSENSISSKDDFDKVFRERERRLDEFRNGFVLRGRTEPVSVPPPRRRSFIKKPSFTKALFRKLRKQKSTSDVSTASPLTGRAGGSMRSAISTHSQMTNHSLPTTGTIDSLAGPSIEENIIDPNITEIYSGYWTDDKRTGLGVAERSDGLRYEGEWLNNMKNGFGVTYFPDGTKEEGRYKTNVLVTELKKTHKLLQLRQARLRESVDDAVRKAQKASKEAQEKAVETATQRSQTARMVAISAENGAQRARIFAQQARATAKEFSPDFVPPSITWQQSGLGFTASQSSPNEHYYAFINAPTLSFTPPPVTLTPSMDMEIPVVLEVSGGNRSGSIRSSYSNNSLSQLAEANEEVVTPQMTSPKMSELSSERRETSYTYAGQKRDPEPPSTRPPSLSYTSYPQQSKVQNQPSLALYSMGKRLDDNYSSSRSSRGSDRMDPVIRIHPLKQIKQDSGLGRDSSFDEPSEDGVTGVTNGHSRGDSGTPDSGMSDMSQNSKGSRARRRRTEPSIMTSPPAPLRPMFMDEVTLSVENLQNADQSAFIIENGIRKRVDISEERQAQERGTDRSSSTREPSQSELAPLPRNYQIRSQTALAKDLGFGSIPDVSVCRQLQREGLISRAEVAKLVQAHKREKFRRETLRTGGQIVIRLADIKDWGRRNAISLIVTLVNVGLAIVFLTLLSTRTPVSTSSKH